MTDRSVAARPRGNTGLVQCGADGFDDSVQSRWWDVAFVGVPTLAAGVVLVGGTEPNDLLSVAALVGMIALWGLFRLLRHRSSSAELVIHVALPVLSLIAIAGSPNAGTIQALVFPFIWTVASTYRFAILNNLAFGVASFFAFVVGLGTATGRGADSSVLVSAAGIAGFSLVFSVAFGTWIARISMWGTERARLLADLTAAQDDLAAAHRGAGERLERERISRELHDTLTQSLTGLVMLSQRATRLAEADAPDLAALRTQLALVDDVAREALGEARAVVASSASLQVDRGLASALSLLAERVTRETGIRVSSTVAGSTSRELEVVLLRCAQEALANVRKHSGATSARVEVAPRGTGLVLSVTDDGTGFDRPDEAASRGFGLTGMGERLALVGGGLEISSTPTGGARLVVTIPEGARA